jgi:hypothetical protein
LIGALLGSLLTYAVMKLVRQSATLNFLSKLQLFAAARLPLPFLDHKPSDHKS